MLVGLLSVGFLVVVLGLQGFLLGHSERLLTVPVLSGGGDGEAGLWVDKWLLGLGHGEWLLSIPVLSGSSNSKTGFWVDKWLSLSSNKSCNSNGFHYFFIINFSFLTKHFF